MMLTYMYVQVTFEMCFHILTDSLTHLASVGYAGGNRSYNVGHGASPPLALVCAFQEREMEREREKKREKETGREEESGEGEEKQGVQVEINCITSLTCSWLCMFQSVRVKECIAATELATVETNIKVEWGAAKPAAPCEGLRFLPLPRYRSG